MPSRTRTPETHPAFSERQYRDALAQLATGVTVLCARAEEDRYVGFTASSFNSVSLQPPLVLWNLAVSSAALSSTFAAAQRYAINVLSASQQDIAMRFARRPHAERFRDVSYRLGWSEAPLIDGCIAWIECRHYAQHRAGDHVIFIGEVVTVERAPGPPLVYHRGQFGTVKID
ncbi:MAG TPA: flavin reductase family protein [Casimicrobiaceae bacterium]|nr:flavin reductase family protein [Casimicrobiaceae bacterium]